MTEQRYQENGFELVVFRSRRPDPYTLCDTCRKPQHHLATMMDEWAEGHSSTLRYHYCKDCDTITQQTIREDHTGTTTRSTMFHQPPHELLVEILAMARSQNGRSVSVMTINRRWWKPFRYPLVLGEMIDEDAPVDDETESVDSGPSPKALPLPRYSPPQSGARNPFTSRRHSQEIPADAMPADVATPIAETSAMIPETDTENTTVGENAPPDDGEARDDL